MANRALFEGLIVDEYDQSVTVSIVGNETCYVVNDRGFHRHISSEEVDRQILKLMKEKMEGHEDILSQETAKMMGQDDIFTRAMLLQQFKKIDQQFETLFQTGIPEDGRAYLGMIGFKVVINIHGEVIEVKQPGMVADEDGDG
jgi:hypothetical protein